MRYLLFATVAAASLAAGCAKDEPAPAAELTTEEDKTLYTIGQALAHNVTVFDFTEEELEVVKAGFTDGVMKREPKVPLEEYLPKIRELQASRMEAAMAVERKSGEETLANAAAQEGAVKTDSGLVLQTLEDGTGASPEATDQVKVHYHGTLPGGKVFDSSVERNEPATFPLNGVIPCWTEGLQMMKVGGKARLTCPSDLAYGDRGAPPDIKPGATLVFEVELLEIVE